jgi:DNA-binding NtrC family response regulator
MLPSLERRRTLTQAAQYRLRGEVGGHVRAYDIVQGDNWIGSVAGNAIVLGVRGVSRRHALLTLDEQGLVLEDMGSKNGTLVNGVRVQRTQLRPGDGVGVGPVLLRVEALPAGDGELAIALKGGSVGPAALPPHETTAVASLEARRPGLGSVEELLTRLIGREGADLPGALALLGRETGVRGACLFVCERRDLVVLAEWGDLPDLAGRPGLRAATEIHGCDPQVAALPGDPPLLLGAARDPEGDPVALCFAGEPRSSSDAERLLRIALLAILAGRGRRPVPAPAPVPPRPPARLRLPDGYVAGESRAMSALYAQMQPVVSGDLPVLLLGETGVGKEGLAHVIHLSSPRHRGPFVAINCAAIPADLLEAEMFGIGRAVATGVGERRGKFQLAEGGTLLLDEIGDMPMALQAKLLRALQEKEIQPVGGPSVPVNIRVVAATNSDLQRRMDEGLFRRDLYYRVAGLALRVPPLRERREDIPALVHAFLTRFTAEAGRAIRGVTVAALRRLREYAWPGNIRELEHEMRRLVYLCPEGQAIDSTLLDARLSALPEAAEPLAADPAPRAPATSAPAESLDLERHLEQTERAVIERALAAAAGNRTQAARLLGISRNGLAIKMERLGLDGGQASK